MNEAELLALRNGDHIRVTRPGNRRSRLAVVIAPPYTVEGEQRHWACVTFAYLRQTESLVDVIGRLSHVAVAGQDRVERA